MTFVNTNPESTYLLGEKLKEILSPYEMEPEEFLAELQEVLTEKDKDMPKKVVKVDLKQDMTALLTRWKEVSEQMAALKSEENQLRVKLVADNFDITKLEGTQTIDIGWGWRLRATKNLNISATNESGQTEALLNQVGKIDPGFAVGLVKWKPELATKVYREVLALVSKKDGEQLAHPELAVAFAAAVTVKPGMPELEMIPPKTEEAPPVVVVESGVSITDGNFPKGF